MAKSKWTDSSSVNELLSRVEKLKLKGWPAMWNDRN